jgi:peptidoglycan hydrolase CwlO-like protein
MNTSPQGSSKDPGSLSTHELRTQIQHTRDELGETVEALAAKADVKSRAKETAAGLKDQVSLKATHAKEQVTATAAAMGDTIRDKAPHPHRQHQAAHAAHGSNTKLLAGAGAGAGVAVALVLLMVVRHKRCR